MWNALQGAAGNFANRASKLAVEVLDAGPPEQLRSHGKQTDDRAEMEPSGVLLNDRLSALKARYKTPTADDFSPPSRESPAGGGGKSDESVTLPNSLEESSELVRLRDQMERLKQEMLHQSVAAEESMKQERYEWTERVKEMEQRHKNEIQGSREEIIKHYQGLLNSKEQELASVREVLSHQGEEKSEGGVVLELQQKQHEIDSLKQQVLDLQQKEINQAFGIAEGQGGSDSDVQQLRSECEELKMKCEKLEALQAEMITPEQMAERDAFWKGEMKAMEDSHRKALDTGFRDKVDEQSSTEEITSLRNDLEQSQSLLQQQKTEKETVQREKQKLEEETARLQQSLEERDGIWQQELISTQKEQQELRKQYEAIKREFAEEKTRHADVCKSYEELENELQNEFELRSAAQAHVRSLQKGMLDIDSGASSVKQQLLDAQNQMQEMKKSYDQRMHEESTALKSQVTYLQQQNQSQTDNLQTMSQRMEDAERERLELQTEIERLSAKERNDGGHVDVAKLTYDFEAAAENLKLAETRNSILGHEVESLTQELEQLKSNQFSVMAEDESDEGGLQSRLRKAESERDSCKEQLKRLKQQMIQMQEDQEASLHWRIDAEVKLALEDFKKKYKSEDGPLKSEISVMQRELESAHQELKQFTTQIEQKDAELMNLQIALGELTYHGEAADKLRRDLRSSQEQIQSLKDEILDAKATAAEAGSARKAAEASADEAHKRMAEQTDKIHQLEGNLFSVKKKLLEASQQLRRMGNDEGTMVDRRLVVQLLVAYLEKKHEKDALDVMARMLGFTEEEKQRVGATVSGRGLLGSVTGGTLALVKGGMSVATFGLLDRGLNSKTGSRLADEWVEFLTKETDPLGEEDPLAYLQKGAHKHQMYSMEDRESAKMTSSEGSLSMHTIPRSDEETAGRRAPIAGASHRHTPSLSPRSERTVTPVPNYTVPELRLPPRIVQPLPKTAMPSFKDFMEKQKDTRSD